MRSKKGDTIVFVLYVLIIFAVIMVLFVVLSGKYDAFLKKFFRREICKESVRMHSRLHIGGIEAFYDVNCPVEEKTIEKGQDIKAKLAYYMAECWDNYGEGRLKLFDNKWIGENKFCAICSHVKFDEKKVIDAKDFLEFLKNDYVPQEFSIDVFEKKDVPYYTYLTGYKTEELDLSTIPLGEYNIDTSAPYGIIFTYTKKGDFFSMRTLQLAGLGAIIGAIAGEAAILPLKGIPFLGKTIKGRAALIVGIVGAAGGAYSSVKLGGISQQVDSAVVLIPYDEIELKKLDCEIFPVETGIKKEK